MPTCTCLGGAVKCPHVRDWEGRLNAHMYVRGREEEREG